MHLNYFCHSASLEEQNIFVAYTEEHVRVTHMLHITRKGIPHDAMPGALILSVKFLKEKK